MDHLFTRFRLRDIHLKNRIVMPALASFLIDKTGAVTDSAVEHYRRRADGGTAMIIMEACAVSAEGVVSPHQARIDNDDYVDGLARVADALRAEGCVPALQLHHAGRQTSARVIGQKPLAPSALPCPAIRGDVEPLTVEDIRRLVTRFGDGAERAVRAGFELIEIHGAHGYLVNQFLSGFSNVRDDAYGGDTERRTRFAVDIVEEVRRRIGPRIPISFKISAQEFVPGGLTVPESVVVMHILEARGVDCVQVSAGNDASHEWISQPMFMERACLAESAAQLRKALSIPVMAVGRINSPWVAETVLANEMADLVCIGRALLADPQLPRKAQEGREDDIRPCIGCNTCMESIFRKGRIECLVNPMLGREREMAIQRTETPRHIMVVGGGPGGLNAAWIAAKRGHEVHLFEKQPVLGGQLLTGSTPPFKKDLLDLVRFQRRQVEKYRVHQHLGRHITIDDIRSMEPDVVILATGSSPNLPPVAGIDKPLVATFSDVLNGDRLPDGPIVVIGGGPTGCELALHLAEAGSRVTLIEMLPKIGQGIEAITKKVVLKKLGEAGVRILTDTRLIQIVDWGAEIADKAGNRRMIEAAKIVMATGTRSEDRLYDEAVAAGFEVYRIGDCLEPRNAKAAIHESAVLARTI